MDPETLKRCARAAPEYQAISRGGALPVCVRSQFRVRDTNFVTGADRAGDRAISRRG
jgi:hypothetical protein